MPNENPIYTGKDGDFVDFQIPQEYLTNKITTSISINLLDEGWKYDSDHILSIQGNSSDLYNDEPPPNNLDIGSGKDLLNKKFRSYSHIRRFRDGADNEAPSQIKFTIAFFGNGEKINEFSCTSDRTNPIDFITDIKFVSL